jgi:hypothetical protein
MPTQPESQVEFPWYVFVVAVVGALLLIGIFGLILYLVGFIKKKTATNSE